jgi:hypothetical protein
VTEPTPWDTTVLALAAFRLTRLVGWDDLTASLRARLGVSDQTYDDWIEVQHQAEERGAASLWAREMELLIPIPFTPAQWWIARLIRCPWCAGFWISLLVAAAYTLLPDGTVIVGLPFALSALVGLLAKHLDP